MFLAIKLYVFLMLNFIKISYNSDTTVVRSNISILEISKYFGYPIPRFCYYKDLSIAGNCRMCLVELKNLDKLILSCSTIVESNMEIITNSIYIKKARENVLETMLINHPLDCPICDQGGECDLQENTLSFGNFANKIITVRRGVEDKNNNFLIKTIMTRCIHCTRCVRFSAEIAKVFTLGTLKRGDSTEIGGYLNKDIISSISGNVIDLCPVSSYKKIKKKGALTNKRESFKYRPWEFKSLETIDITDSLTTNIFINKKESKIFRILPKKNSNLIKSIITNNARYSYDALSLNRLYNIFNIDKKKLYKTFSETIEKLFGDFIIQKKILFFINDRSNLILINKLKFLSILQKNIEIFSISNFYNFKNVYKYYKNSKHYLKTNTFLLGLSLNTELPVLWSKILFYLSPYNSFFYTTCNNIKEFEDKSMFNLQNSDIIELYEGKKKNFSNSLNTMQILFGEAFQKRWTNTSFVFNNEINNILFIFTSPNFESNDFLLIKSFNLKKFYLSNLILFVSIYDNIIFRKILHLKKRVKILFNSHFLSFNEKNILHFPIKSEYFEQNGIFINFKKVPQKSQKIVENITRSKSLLSIIFNFFPRTNDKFHYLNFFKENINNSFIFYESFFSDFYLKNIYINFKKYKVLKYFLKTIPNSSFDEFQKNSYNLKTSYLRLSSLKY